MKTMSSRERVRRTLEFDNPDRVPRDLWILPIARRTYGDATIESFRQRWPVDIIGAPNNIRPHRTRGQQHAVGQFTDAWGCVYENLQDGVIGEVKNPLIDDWSKLSDLRPPTELLGFDRDKVNRFCVANDRWILAGSAVNTFERLQFLRGSENLYLDIAEESAEFFQLLKIVHDFDCKQFEAWSQTGIDALSFSDDWGSQRALLINPAQWRKIFKPIYARYAQIAHRAGKKIFMHSDGYIFDIYEDLIEIGIDAINSQLFCMNIEEIGRRFKGRITFWGEIDRQQILPHATAAECRAAVQRVIENLYSPRGGVIAQFELGAAAKLENAEAIFKAWLSPSPLVGEGRGEG
jgi:hypothetical protein